MNSVVGINNSVKNIINKKKKIVDLHKNYNYEISRFKYYNQHYNVFKSKILKTEFYLKYNIGNSQLSIQDTGIVFKGLDLYRTDNEISGYDCSIDLDRYYYWLDLKYFKVNCFNYVQKFDYFSNKRFNFSNYEYYKIKFIRNAETILYSNNPYFFLDSTVVFDHYVYSYNMDSILRAWMFNFAIVDIRFPFQQSDIKSQFDINNPYQDQRKDQVDLEFYRNEFIKNYRVYYKKDDKKFKKTYIYFRDSKFQHSFLLNRSPIYMFENSGAKINRFQINNFFSNYNFDRLENRVEFFINTASQYSNKFYEFNLGVQGTSFEKNGYNNDVGVNKKNFTIIRTIIYNFYNFYNIIKRDIINIYNMVQFFMFMSFTDSKTDDYFKYFSEFFNTNKFKFLKEYWEGGFMFFVDENYFNRYLDFVLLNLYKFLQILSFDNLVFFNKTIIENFNYFINIRSEFFNNRSDYIFLQILSSIQKSFKSADLLGSNNVDFSNFVFNYLFHTQNSNSDNNSKILVGNQINSKDFKEFVSKNVSRIGESNLLNFSSSYSYIYYSIYFEFFEDFESQMLNFLKIFTTQSKFNVKNDNFSFMTFYNYLEKDICKHKLFNNSRKLINNNYEQSSIKNKLNIRFNIVEIFNINYIIVNISYMVKFFYKNYTSFSYIFMYLLKLCVVFYIIFIYQCLVMAYTLYMSIKIFSIAEIG